MTELFFEYEPTAAYLDDAKRELFCSRLPEGRAARIRSPRAVQKRAERAAAEAAFRRACRRAGESYAALCIAYTASGKPYVDGRPDLSISFSHTASFGSAVLVKTSGGDAPQVGLDLAGAADVPARSGEIARRFFSPAELEAWGSAAPDMQTDEFLRTWCRYEARVKMSGEGIGGNGPSPEPATLHQFTISCGALRHHVAIALSAAHISL